MIGKLSIDKSSMNISYFLKSIDIIANNNGKISRDQFTKKMSEFIGVTSTIDSGKENRTAYNKTKLPRYFGFITFDKENNLILTPRGKLITKFIVINNTSDNTVKYDIAVDACQNFSNLILNSIIFDSFGKNNCGVEQSKSDIEPPKVIFKALYLLKKATAEELFYILFSPIKQQKNFYEAVEEVKQNRTNNVHNFYSNILSNWELTNFVNDPKIINFFLHNSIKLLVSERDEETNELFYKLSSQIPAFYLDLIENLEPVYRPLNLFIYSRIETSKIISWLNTSIIGRISEYENFVFCYDCLTNSSTSFASSTDSLFHEFVFEKALLSAYNNPDKNVYIFIKNTTESEFVNLFSHYYPLLTRLNNVFDEKHAYSSNTIDAPNCFKFLINNSRNAKKILSNNHILIPSNLNVIGTIIMNNSNQNLTNEFKFQRFILLDEKASIPNKTSQRNSVGNNYIYYGVPGSGKSHKIKEDYKPNADNSMRVVFHPDYTYSDFVGQILPKISKGENGSENKLEYKFMPGPFTQILKKAYVNPEQQFYLIIEELNRGNAPAIFGEIFQLLDRNASGESEYSITNAEIADIVFENAETPIKIPANLSILATMNTSDQNVFTMDTAFQRRWIMVYVPNKFESPQADYSIVDTKITWKAFAETVNKKLAEISGELTSTEDKSLGAYFARKEDFEDRSRFAEKVLKYLWDDAFKMERSAIFKSSFNTLSSIIETFKNDKFKNPLSEVLNSEIYEDICERMKETSPMQEQVQSVKE